MKSITVTRGEGCEDYDATPYINEIKAKYDNFKWADIWVRLKEGKPAVSTFVYVPKPD